MSFCPLYITFRDFASLCVAAYNTGATRAGAFARVGETDQRLSGFQGAIYRRATGGGFDWVVAVAGTQPSETMGADLVADAGFGGLPPPVGVPLVTFVMLAGSAVLWHQVSCAEDLVRAARGAMGSRDRLLVTGHSLGGGIAQIVAARQNIPAVAISAPSVTRVRGVEAAYLKNRPQITCLKVRRDPINHTGAIGRWLGRVVVMDSPRTGGAAHSIDATLTELEPAGEFSRLGLSDPFAA